MKNYFFIALLLFLFVSCRKDAKHKVNEKTLVSKVQNVSYILKNDIFFMDNLDGESTQITFSPEAIKTDIKMSYDYQKFAILNVDGVIEIIDRAGATIAVLNEYGNVKSFDWSTDSKTLWMLNNNDLVFFGPDMNIPALTFPDLTNGVSATINVDLLDISVQGDLAYVASYKWYPNSTGLNMDTQDYSYSFIRKLNDGSENLVHISQNYPTHNYTNLKFSKKGDYISVVSQNSNVNIFKGVDLEPTFKKSGSYSSPIYNSSLNILLYAKLTGDNLPLSKIHLENVETNNITIVDKVQSYEQVLYVDWK